MDAKTKKALLEATDELREQILSENLDGIKQALQVLDDKIRHPVGTGTNGPEPRP